MVDFWHFLLVEGALSIGYQGGIFSLEKLLCITSRVEEWWEAPGCKCKGDHLTWMLIISDGGDPLLNVLCAQRSPNLNVGY